MRVLEFILAAGVILLLNIPMLQAPLHYHIWRYVGPLGAAWVLVAAMNGDRRIGPLFAARKPGLALYVLWSFVFLGYEAVFSGNMELICGTESQQRVLNWIGITLCYAIGIVHSCEVDNRRLATLRNLFLLGLGVNAILCIPAELSDDLVVRQFINAYQFEDMIRPNLWSYALGDLGVYCAMALALPVAVSLSVGSRTRQGKILGAVTGLALLGCILLSSLLMVILAALLGILIVCFLGVSRRGRGRMRIALLLLMALIGAAVFFESDLQAVRYPREKFMSILRVGEVEDKAGMRVGRRMDRYQESWDVLVRNPVLGIAQLPPATLAGEDHALGGHSSLLDGFAIYGLLFLPFPLFIARLTSNAWRRMKQANETSERGVEVALLGAYILILIFDPVTLNMRTSGTFLFLLGTSAPRIALGGWGKERRRLVAGA